MLNSLFRRRQTRPTLHGPRSTSPALSLEPLEDRWLPSISLLPSWVEQGPGPITGNNTNTEGLQFIQVAGAVTSLAPHPTAPNPLYAATTNAALLRTNSPHS